MMDAGSVLSVIATLEHAGVSVWLDGGWGVDALLGEQTRDHDDLDCVIALSDAPMARDALTRPRVHRCPRRVTDSIRGARPN